MVTRLIGKLTWIVMCRHGWGCCFLNQDFQDFQDWDDAGALFSPSAPVSGTGTGFDSSLIKGPLQNSGV